MHKFRKGDPVRVTYADHFKFDAVGKCDGTYFDGVDVAYYVRFPGDKRRWCFLETSLTLADPEPHTVPPALNRRAEVLRTAESLVNGDRADDYGPPETNFRRIAALWDPIIGAPISPEQVALCMAQVKIARLITTPGHEDSWIDICGYAALGAEIAAGGDDA